MFCFRDAEATLVSTSGSNGGKGENESREAGKDRLEVETCEAIFVSSQGEKQDREATEYDAPLPKTHEFILAGFPAGGQLSEGK